MTTILKEKKGEIIKKFRVNKNDTGSAEVQVALLTERIKDLSLHLKANKKDFHSRLGLLKMVSRRKRLLSYLKNEDYNKYKKLIKSLKLRK